MLSEDGVRQARAVADRWPFDPPAAVYASPLVRSVQSAMPLSERFRRPVRIRACLEEWTPTLRDLVEDGYLEMESHCWADPDLVPESGESLRMAQRRIVRCLGAIGDAHPRETAAVSGHGSLFALFAADVKNERPSNEYKRTIGFCDVAVFERNASGFEIRREFGTLD